MLPIITVLASRPNAKLLELLIRVSTPKSPTALTRPLLNLALVIDRSGSMAGQRLEYAKAAAKYAIGQLTALDKVSITIFDDQVKTIAASQAVHNPSSFSGLIDAITSNGSTDLHGGWLEGAAQAASSLEISRLNRVLLLSDGQANHGEVRPDEICRQVSGLAQKGISTSAIGVGTGFNEDLLEAIANNGDGNYHFIQDPKALPDIFALELQGLLATFGRIVSLGLEPRLGVKVLDVLNDLEKTNTGRYKLDNLRFGQQLEVVLRLEIAQPETADILDLRLAYTDTNGTRQIQKLGVALPILGIHPQVQEAVALLEAARGKLVATQLIDRGDIAGASHELKRQQTRLAAMPQSPAMRKEIQKLEQLADNISQNSATVRKEALSQRYERSKKGA